MEAHKDLRELDEIGKTTYEGGRIAGRAELAEEVKEPMAQARAMLVRLSALVMFGGTDVEAERKKMEAEPRPQTRAGLESCAHTRTAKHNGHTECLDCPARIPAGSNGWVTQ